jgi:hypothetical protein
MTEHVFTKYDAWQYNCPTQRFSRGATVRCLLLKQ